MGGIKSSRGRARTRPAAAAAPEDRGALGGGRKAGRVRGTRLMERSRTVNCTHPLAAGQIERIIWHGPSRGASARAGTGRWAAAPGGGSSSPEPASRRAACNKREGESERARATVSPARRARRMGRYRFGRSPCPLIWDAAGAKPRFPPPSGLAPTSPQLLLDLRRARPLLISLAFLSRRFV